mgnify:CR=1 FL=1
MRAAIRWVLLLALVGPISNACRRAAPKIGPDECALTCFGDDGNRDVPAEAILPNHLFSCAHEGKVVCSQPFELAEVHARWDYATTHEIVPGRIEYLRPKWRYQVMYKKERYEEPMARDGGLRDRDRGRGM